jgi:hypothetical protein
MTAPLLSPDARPDVHFVVSLDRRPPPLRLLQRAPLQMRISPRGKVPNMHESQAVGAIANKVVRGTAENPTLNSGS